MVLNLNYTVTFGKIDLGFCVGLGNNFCVKLLLTMV